MTIRGYRDIVQYQLGAAMTNAQTTMTLVHPPVAGHAYGGTGGLTPTFPFTMAIQDPSGTNREVVNVTGFAGGGYPSFNIDRAQNSTLAVAHVISPTTEIVTQIVGENDMNNVIQAGTVAGGGLAGTFPNPTIAQAGATINQVLTWNGTAYVPTNRTNVDLTDSPDQHGTLLGWTMDPQTGPTGSAVVTNTRLYLNRIYVPVSGTAATLYTYVSVAGTGGATTNGNWCGIYDTSYNLLATSAAQDTAFASTGLITMALTPSVTLTGGNFYYLALTAAFVTTPPQFPRNGAINAALTNLLQSATAPATAHCVSKTAVITALPNPLAGAVTDSPIFFLAVGS